MVALDCRRPARAVRQYQKNRECQGRRLVLKYGSPISTEICGGHSTHTHSTELISGVLLNDQIGQYVCGWDFGLNVVKWVEFQQRILENKELRQP